MGGGRHGGFKNTVGARDATNNSLFKRIYFEGTVKVGGVERDVSRRVYQRGDIDFEYVDPDSGRSNLQLMKKGNAPIGNDGNPVQLHHILQKESGPMVEVRETTHQEYKRIIHGLIENGDSFRKNNELEKQYNNFRKKYWQWRAREYEKGRRR